jgi:peptidoglycan/xylan/chitin deacetylase (PgdA/CDA1 family)
MYHDVIGPDGIRGGFEGAGAAVYAVTADQFERQMDGIEAALGRAPARADATAGSADGDWMLTFDDGGSSAAAAGAALARRGWSGHFFVVTAMVGKPGFLDWDEIEELAAQGHVVGSHSHSHPARIADCSEAELSEEWGGSVAALSARLGTPVTTASVPGGSYSEPVGRAVAEAGVTTLFTSEPRRAVARIENCALVGRFAVRASTDTPAIVAAAAGEWRPWLRQRAAWSARGVAKRLAGGRYEQLRARVLSRRGSRPAGRTRPPG